MDYLFELKNLILEKKIKLNSEITLSATFKELGLDSLQQLDLVQSIEDKFSKRIDDNKLIKIKTVQDLINALKNA
jgi:acyl carrier protein